MARGIDEGLDQSGAGSVAHVPVNGSPPGSRAEDSRGKPLELDPGQDQEAGVADDLLKVALPGLIDPADAAFPRWRFPGAGTETDQGNQPMAGDGVVPAKGGFRVSKFSPDIMSASFAPWIVCHVVVLMISGRPLGQDHSASRTNTGTVGQLNQRLARSETAEVLGNTGNWAASHPFGRRWLYPALRLTADSQNVGGVQVQRMLAGSSPILR